MNKTISSLFCMVVAAGAYSIPETHAEINEKEDPSDFFGAVFSFIINNDSIEKNIDPALESLIGELAADTVKHISMAKDVLSFLTDTYSEHGYDETGSWEKPNSFRQLYMPYDGELPEYTPGDFRLPIIGKLTSRYGFRKKYGRFHQGIDMALSMGDTVKVALPGIVSKIAYQNGGYGNYVVVSHAGNVETVYGHLGASIVTPGQKLEAGDPVGIGGNTGNSTGPHLHFETRYRGIAFDPISWFGLEGLLR